MPLYNALRTSPHYLPEAIESVLGQTVPDFELILVDDASEEDYAPVKARYADSRLRWIRLDENGGQAAARNRGVDAAKGAMVAFIDQDDRWYPQRLEAGLRAYKECVMTYSEIDEIDAAGRVMMYKALAAHQPGRHPISSLADLVSRDSLVLPGACLLSKETFMAAGGFDPRLSGYEDDDFFMRVFRLGQVRFIDKPLMQYRIYSESYRSSERMDRSRLYYFRKLVGAFADNATGASLVREKIAPRFSGLWLTRMRYALRMGSAGIYRTAAAGLRETSARGGARLQAGRGATFRHPLPRRTAHIQTPALHLPSPMPSSACG